MKTKVTFVFYDSQWNRESNSTNPEPQNQTVLSECPCNYCQGESRRKDKVNKKEKRNPDKRKKKRKHTRKNCRITDLYTPLVSENENVPISPKSSNDTVGRNRLLTHIMQRVGQIFGGSKAGEANSISSIKNPENKEGNHRLVAAHLIFASIYYVEHFIKDNIGILAASLEQNSTFMFYILLCLFLFTRTNK